VLERWEAERLDNVFGDGRTKPFVAECSLVDVAEISPSDPETERFVVKSLGNPHVTEFSLFNEVVGNLLARRLGLNTPEPALIKITENFAEAAHSTVARYSYSIVPGTAAGAAFLGTGLLPPSAGVISGDTLEQLVRIYAFDLVMQNPDRRVDKPNCMVQRGNVIAFDFELCFSFIFAIPAADPCDFCSHGIARRHLFHSVLSSALSKVGIDWQPFLKSLKALSDEQVHNITLSVPSEWATFAGKIEQHIKFMRTQEARIELELHRSLR